MSRQTNTGLWNVKIISLPKGQRFTPSRGHTVVVSLMTVLLQTVHGTAHTARQLAKEIHQYAKEKKNQDSLKLLNCFIAL